MTFKPKDPRGALEKERSIAASIETQLSVLAEKRAELLLGDDVDAVLRHDADIARLQRSAAIHGERIAGLAAAARRLDHEEAERARREAVDQVVAPAVAALIAEAGEYEHLLLQVCDAHQQLIEHAAAIVRDMPPEVPRTDSLWLAFIEMNLFVPFPNQSAANFIAMLNGRAKNVSASVAKSGETFLHKCRTTPLPGADDDIARAA